MSKAREGKRSKSERERNRRNPPGPEYAEAAINLYRHKMYDEPVDFGALGKLSDDDRRDANAMAAALLVIHQLLDKHAKLKQLSPADLPASGLTQAYDLLNALTTGRDWPPFWRFLAGLRSGKRTQNAAPGEFESFRRSIISGFALALQEAVKRETNKDNETKAIQRVIEICQLPGVTFTVDQIRKWRTQ
jgi:hypothetical protein